VKNVGLRSEQVQRVKSLVGYDKKSGARPRESEGHRLVELAQPDLEADIEKQFSLVRDAMSYRRRELEVAILPGLGTIRTPDFEYQVAVSVDPSDPSSVVWRREVVCLGSSSVARGTAFRQVFGGSFDTLFCEFLEPTNLTAIIDDLEERQPPGIRLDYDSRCSWCEIRREGNYPLIRIERTQLTVGSSGGTPVDLSEWLAELGTLFGKRAGVPEVLG